MVRMAPSVHKVASHPRRVRGGRIRNWTKVLVFLVVACIWGPRKQAEGQLRWQFPKKAPIRVRLVALAYADRPRSSYFSSQEIFVAEREITQDEWGLVKLVFTFLPYQPRLSESGFDYSVVHEVSAWRHEDCDQTIDQLTARNLPDRHEPLIYSRNFPRKDLDRKLIHLRCYETNADDYIKSSLEPVTPLPKPVLNARPNPR
jgi:hypothetical protein